MLRRHYSESLRRLEVDLLYYHAPAEDAAPAEAAGFFREMLDAGTTRAVGVLNLSVDQMSEFRSECPIVACQVRYNWLQREIEADIVPWCRENLSSQGPAATHLPSRRAPLVSWDPCQFHALIELNRMDDDMFALRRGLLRPSALRSDHAGGCGTGNIRWETVVRWGSGTGVHSGFAHRSLQISPPTVVRWIRQYYAPI